MGARRRQRGAGPGVRASLRGKRIFPPNNRWNQDISQEPVDPDSATFISSIGLDQNLHPDFGTVWEGARQWCGRLGKVENCQVGIFMGYVTREEHALVNMRLYLPQEWTGDGKRCAEAGVRAGTRFRTRHELALAMLDEQWKLLPHGWVAGDDEMGRPADFRRELRAGNERYLLAVPSNTLICDLETDPAADAGHGGPAERPFVQVRRWCAALPATAWTKARRARWHQGAIGDRGSAVSGDGAVGQECRAGRAVVRDG